MLRPSNKQKAAASRAHAAAATKLRGVETSPILDLADSYECTTWTGGVSHYVPSDSDSEWEDDSHELASEEEEELSELEGEELSESVRAQLEKELVELQKPTLYERLTQPVPKKTWMKAESNRSLGYNGRSVRTKREKEKAARDKEKTDAEMRKSASAVLMRQFFMTGTVPTQHKLPAQPEGAAAAHELLLKESINAEIFAGYLSDMSTSEEETDDEPVTVASPNLTPVPLHPTSTHYWLPVL
ncbi:hypothetical protein A0H81_06581 [Grifola frondosa]|uniref:Uncharacterized protein n=1 Tax=Grifola frondosa TaxID=5627 RepID=A0A1C7MAN6_GRIFR|nr:hypothetical protein A0H81_06581 [Grifola frondosa]